MDGGQTWEASSLPPMTMRLLPLLPPILGITCPANTTVQVGRVTSAVVNYPAPTAWGGCAPLTLTCVPPSGSVFPLGNTMVNGLVEDDCGQQAGCSFVVRVERSNAPAFYFPTKLQPPLPGAYVSARGGHAAFANGVVLRDFRQRLFSQSILPPPLGDSAQVAFGSLVELELSTDSGATWQPASAPADATIRLSHVADAEEEEHYDTEMLALSVSGGTLPAGVLIRESPTKASVGGRAIAPVVRGFMISSFFDIFTEVSVDGGLTWWPSTGDTLRLELRPMAELMPPVATPSRLCPPPNDAYASPPGAGIETDFGLLFRDVKTKLFSSAQPPPAAGGTVLQTMSGEIDLLYSTDNGISWLPARAPASLDLRLRRFTEGETDLCDTELERLTIAGGDLPGGVTIRESPTLPSRGMTRLADRGGGGGGAVVQSFFDIFTEVSTDGGGSWASPTNGPLRERLVSVADEEIFADSLWPPANGRYRGADQWTAYTASGLVITNFLLRSCSPSFVPPPPGMAQPCFFSAWATFSLSLDGGLTYSSEVAPVTATARLSSSRDSGFARYFDTEMLQLDIAGGTLPGGIRARESPTRPSLGRLSQHDEGLGTAYCDSFFDIFLEVSTDGGGNWEPTVTPPATLVLEPWHTPPLSIACPLDQWVRATRLGGDFVSFPPPEVLGGCPPVGVDVVPPSGSFFPDGATTVMCTATDSCGQVARCSFTVTVLPNDVPPEYAFTTNTLPPQYAEDISPRQRFAAYPNGFVLRDLRHHGFSASFPPPPPGGSATQSFSSQVDFEYSADGGLTYLPASGPAIVTIAFSNVLSGAGCRSSY